MNNWDTLINIAGLTELADQYHDYQEELKQSESELITMMSNDDARWQHITFEELFRLSFDKAHKVIDSFSIQKRIKLTNDLLSFREKLYLFADRFDSDKYDPEFRISASEFAITMSKIKHVEVIQLWLYGIN